MEQMEKVERLREKTGCSYSEAKAALEETGGDLLEALCWLEQHNKTQLTGASCSTADRESPKAEPEQTDEAPKESGPFINGCKSLWEGLVLLLRRCNQTELVMTGKTGRREFGVPLTLFIVLLMVAFWAVLALIVVALFFGNRFSVEGALRHEDVNEVLGKATDFAEGIKEELRNDPYHKDKCDGDNKE